MAASKKAVIAAALALVAALAGLSAPAWAQEAPAGQPATAPVVAPAAGLSEASVRYICAAVVVAVALLATGYAVAHVGAAALGAATERPEMLGRSLLFVGLAEGIAIYGILIAIIMLFVIR